MAVSKAVVPMLSGEVAETFMQNISMAKIKPYSLEKKDETMAKIEMKMRERNRR